MPINPDRYHYLRIPFEKGPNGEVNPVLQRIWDEAGALQFRPAEFGIYGRMLFVDRDRHIYPDLQSENEQKIPADLWYPPSYLANLALLQEKQMLQPKEPELPPDEAKIQKEKGTAAAFLALGDEDE